MLVPFNSTFRKGVDSGAPFSCFSSGMTKKCRVSEGTAREWASAFTSSHPSQHQGWAAAAAEFNELLNWRSALHNNCTFSVTNFTYSRTKGMINSALMLLLRGVDKRLLSGHQEIEEQRSTQAGHSLFSQSNVRYALDFNRIPHLTGPQRVLTSV